MVVCLCLDVPGVAEEKELLCLNSTLKTHMGYVAFEGDEVRGTDKTGTSVAIRAYNEMTMDYPPISCKMTAYEPYNVSRKRGGFAFRPSYSDTESPSPASPQATEGKERCRLSFIDMPVSTCFFFTAPTLHQLLNQGDQADKRQYPMVYLFNPVETSFYCFNKVDVENCSDVQVFAKVEEGKFVTI